MTAIENDVVQEFRAFEKENGPSFIWGQISSPYVGCFYLNVCAIVKGDFAYIPAELHRFSRYRRFVADTPDTGVEGVECVRLEDIENVLSRSCTELEFHPLSELAPNVPHARVPSVLDICRELDYAALVEGNFQCNLCETDLLHVDGISYLEGEFHGNGGVGIEVGAPVCSECYDLQHCSYCGRECEPDFQDVTDSGHCISCAPDKVCSLCHEDIDLGWNPSPEAIEGYRTGHCSDCCEEVKRGEEENEKYTTTEAATGSLFRK